MSALHMERVCRLCCAIKDRMRPLFEQRQEYPLPLSQMIYSIVDLTVDPDDGLPQKICPQCVNSLMKIYNTIQSYRENDLFLRKHLIRTKPAEMEVLVEMEEINIKQEVVEENCHGSELPSGSMPMKDSDERQNVAPVDEGPSFEPNICIKNEPLDLHDEDGVVTDEDVTVDVPTPDLGPQQSTAAEASRPKLNDHKCYICKSESYESSTALLMHLNGAHKGLLPFTCSECVMETVVLNTLLALNMHLRQHSNPEKCPYCDKRYLTKARAAYHVRQQHPPVEDDSTGPTKCDHCDEQFPSKISLLEHVKLVHFALSQVSCEACGAVFNGKRQLRFHFQREHSQTTKQFDCTICQKKLASLQTLESHLKTFHSNLNQEFKCTYCPKAYSTVFSKRIHERKHTRNPNYKARQNWTQYYTTLEGQKGLKYKKHKCNFCGEITRKIIEHLQGEHFSVTYDCDICGKSFKRLSTLREHSATHNRTFHPIPQSGEHSNADGLEGTSLELGLFEAVYNGVGGSTD